MDIGEVISWFDWIDKADGLLRGLWFAARGRGSAQIEFTPPAGTSAGDMERTLWRYKIPVYGRQALGKVEVEGVKYQRFALRTTQTQRNWAEYVLLRAGAYVWNLHDPRNAQWAAQFQGPPPAWADGPQPGQAQPPERPGPGGAGQQGRPRSSGPVRRTLRDLW